MLDGVLFKISMGDISSSSIVNARIFSIEALIFHAWDAVSDSQRYLEKMPAGFLLFHGLRPCRRD